LLPVARLLRRGQHVVDDAEARLLVDVPADQLAQLTETLTTVFRDSLGRRTPG
jgi:hypothetical protein